MNNPIVNISSEESSNTAANAAKVDVVTDHIENISLTSCYWYLASLYYRTPGWYDNYNNKCDDSDCTILLVLLYLVLI